MTMKMMSMMMKMIVRRSNCAVSDFLQFVEQFGLSQGDAGNDARFDLDGNDTIGIDDFLIFSKHFGKAV